MLVHLSTSSPYVCDLSLGPIEQANRMASAPTKTSLPYLELKESFPRSQQIRTPLKLLAPDEVPMNTSTTTTNTDANQSRPASLQPVWYTEQTIVDDNIDQQQRTSSTSLSSHRHDRTRSTLATIASNSPEIEDEIIEKEALPNKPSLMRKSSTFVIEQQPSVDIPSTLNESEKENDLTSIITSTQEETQKPIRHPVEPSEESFRALEHLLGLGSTNTNLTMGNMTQESPKSNHESLSLTIVTPTELINQTGASLHLSYAPAGGGSSLPSSQNILVMPTIESITEPSMNSTIPPPFEVDNSELEEPSSTSGTVINPDVSRGTEESFHFTDEDGERPETPKDETYTEEDEDDNNFSFELNDFPNMSKETTGESVTPSPAPAPTTAIRAPTCADVAYRALIKARFSGRGFQPVKTESPLAKPSLVPLTVRSSVPVPSPTPTARVLRSSSRRISTDPVVETLTKQEIDPANTIAENEDFAKENKTNDEYPPIELVEVVSVPEEDEMDPEPPAVGITLNLTETKEVDATSPTSAEEADCSASSSSFYISPQQDASAPVDAHMPVLSREFTYNTPTSRKTRSSQRRSIFINRQSVSHSNNSIIPPILEQQATISEEEHDLTTYSIPYSSKTLLTSLSTNATAISEAPPMILQKSLAGSASPSPNPTPIITVRQSERLSSSLSPRRSINPLHSSTPSVRNKTLQMVSIGEQEQLSTTVPKHLNIDVSTEDVEMLDNEQQVDVPIAIHHVADGGVQTSPVQSPRRIDIGIQTTPSLDPLSRRRFQAMEQQTSPAVARSSSSSGCQTTPIAIKIQQTSPMVQASSSKMIVEEREHHQVTPIHSKAIMHLRRNVRFQFTPSTDARLAAKEKLEEEQRHVNPDMVISTMQSILSDNEREEDTEEETTKTKKKISSSKKKKALVPVPQTDDSSEEMNESPVRRTTRNRCQKDPPAHEEPKTNDADVVSTTHSKKNTSKRPARKEKPPSPVKELPSLQPEVIVIDTSLPTTTAKRAGRKRANPKTTATSPPETISPPEPVSKRVKTTTKTIEVKPAVRVPSIEASSARGRLKTPVMSSVSLRSASPSEPVDPPPTNVSKKAKKSSSESSPTENPPPATNNKRKHAASTITKSKRRLHSVEQDEGLNTADEEETVQKLAEPVEATPMDLEQDERDKIEGLTVAELKNRLTAHHEALPKGARKADLVALLVKIEMNSLQEKKKAKIVITPADPPPRKTRRKK